MAAKIKVDQIESVDGSANITLNNSITMASGKTLPAASLTGALPAINGAALTGISHAPEGTAVLSTGETGTSKYLRIDGDNSCSWQTLVIANDAIDSQHYAAGSIDAEHLAANSVDSAAYVDGSIDLAHLSADCVDGTKIADNAINSEHYTDDSIDSAHYAAGSVDNTALSTSLGDLSGKGITDIGLDSGDMIEFTNTELRFHCNNAERMRLVSNGDLHVDGDVIAYSTTVPSSIALKHDVNIIDNALDKLAQLRGVSFTYNKDNKKSAGVIAEEVQKVLPQAVKSVGNLKDESKNLAVNYNALTSILIEAIKELTAKVEKLENK